MRLKMRLMRFSSLIFSILLLSLLAIFPTAAQDDTTVTMIVTRDPVSLDPHAAVDPGAPILMNYVYDTLVYQSPEGEVLPSLAENWMVSDDNLTITFELKPDIVFSDGSPVNADAVIYTFERLQEVGQRSLIYTDIQNINGFQKVDDLTVSFTLAEPSATLLSALTYPYGAILSPSAVEAAGESYGLNPVGTGPFMLESWTAESEIIFIPNPNYTGHRPWTEAATPPSIERLAVRFSTDEAARVNALEAGEADIIYLTSCAQLDRITDGYTILESPARALIYAGFNTARAPFDDPAVRRAIEQAINKDDILAIAAEGIGQVTGSPLPPTIFGYDEAIAASSPAFDVAAAQAALTESGVQTPLSINILTSTFPTFESIAVVMQSQLAALGINAEITVLDFAAVREAALAGDYDLLITRYDWNDPDVLWRYFGTANQGDTNRLFYSNPALDELLIEGRTTFDQDERYQIYNDAQQLLLEDAPIIPLYVPVTIVVVSDRIQNTELLHSHVVLEDAVVGQNETAVQP
jgi:peptide/nickel transport system substrate-binding protein